MGKLLYITNTSLDGFIEDASGDFQFSEPSDEVFAFITDLIRPCSTFVYGRRLYESMQVWETDPTLGEGSERNAEFARVWQEKDKVVYSTTLSAPVTERTIVEPKFTAESLRAVAETAAGDLTIGGAEFAAHAFAAGLVDEVQLFMSGVALGAGRPALPTDQRIKLQLLDERSFGNGAVYVRYAVNR